MRCFPALSFLAVALLAGASHAQQKAQPHKTARAPVSAAIKAVPAAKIWHTPKPDTTAPTDEQGRPMLVLQALNHTDRVAIAAHGERGGFTAEDLDRAAHVLREPSTGNEHPIDPRVLDLVYRVQTHFGAHEIRIISGYRTPRKNGTSNHGKGRAIDLVVPGATDEEVAKFAREQGFVGVGVYPRSGFVHLDVRERSYFWIDTSGPGKRARTRGILADVASKSDASALARGEKPIGPFGIGSDVDAALAKSAPQKSDAPSEDDDTDTSD
jgi:uncharacterized protein YcbK (DUF882 family)